MKLEDACQYVHLEPGRWICVRCDQATPEGIFLDQPPMRNCKMAELLAERRNYRCVEFGKFLRQGRAKGCSGSWIPFDIHVCNIHGECSLLTKNRASDQVKGCDRCVDSQLEPR